jgi:hypothetical protein
MKPTVADSRIPNRLILRGPAGDLPPVTARSDGTAGNGRTREGTGRYQKAQ